MRVIPVKEPAIPKLSPLTVEFLTWIATRRRTYGETMEAWRSTCPRHCVWEDALADGFVQVIETGDTLNDSIVEITPLAKGLLNGRRT